MDGWFTGSGYTFRGTYQLNAINYKVYEITHPQFHALRASNTYEPPGGAGAFPTTVAIIQEGGASWKMRRVIPSTAGGGTTPGTGMTWKVYQVSSLADLNMIKDPGHNEPNWGTWPITVAVFQQGPTWRIQKVRNSGPGPDGTPNTADDTYVDDGYVMGTNPTALPSGLAPIAVDQYFSDPNRLTIFPLKGTYQQGSGTAPGGGTTPPSGGGMTWKVYQVSSLADLNMIKDPGHNEPNWGTFPITVALFQQGVIVSLIHISETTRP